jgi:hypothetical protein
MGHTRLGELPTGRKWKAVVEALIATQGQGEVGYGVFADDVGLVALKTLDAAKNGLNKALDDEGLRYTFYLLTQLALASRQEDWKNNLSELGINLHEEISPFGLTSELQNAIDGHLSQRGHPTDISEMAQQAAGEALTSLTADKASTLFGSGELELKNAVRHLSTRNGFGELGQRFFGAFMARFLNFYLSRATAGQVGGNKLRSVQDVTTFNDILRTHCEQSALILRAFCGEWYSKTEFVEGIDLDNTSRFMAVAVKKLQSELQQQRKRL